jgi:hypothetical protein
MFYDHPLGHVIADIAPDPTLIAAPAWGGVIALGAIALLLIAGVVVALVLLRRQKKKK